MARFLGSDAPTGKFDSSETATDSRRVDSSELLSRALERLTSCAFIGLMERYTDSMLMLKWTFPEELEKFTTYQTSPHASTDPSKYTPAPITAAHKQAIRSANSLDIALYERAVELFDARFESAVKIDAKKDQAPSRGHRIDPSLRFKSTGMKEVALGKRKQRIMQVENFVLQKA